MARKLTKKNNKAKKIVKKAPVAKTSSKASTQKVAVNLPTSKYIEGVGRRKVATARVRLWQEAGDFIVNDQAAGQYFDEVVNPEATYLQPLEIVGLKGKVTVSAKVSGSGISAQLDAVVHGLSRALVSLNPDFKPLLKAEGLLTRDDRMKETRKIGTGGKARRKRQSPKR